MFSRVCSFRDCQGERRAPCTYLASSHPAPNHLAVKVPFTFMVRPLALISMSTSPVTLSGVDARKW